MKNIPKFCLLVLFTFFARELTTQIDPIDSLTSQVTLTVGKEKINTLILLAEANRIYDFQESILTGKEAVRLAKEIKDYNLHALAIKSVGVSYLYEGDLKQALLYFEESLELYAKVENRQGMANCLNNIGLVYLYRGNYGKAAKYYQENLSIVRNLNNISDIASALLQLGNVNYYCGRYRQSLDNYFQAALIYTNFGDISGQADAYYSMGVIYSEIKSFEEALKYYQNADSIYRLTQNKRDLSHVLNNMARIYSLEFKDFEKAKALYEESLKLKKQLDDNVGIAMAYNNIGTVYGSIGEYKTAQTYFTKSLDLYNKIGSESGLIMVGYNLGELYCEKNNLELGIDYYLRSLEMAIKNEEVSYINKNYEALFLAYARQCDFEKFNHYYSLFSIGKDTLIDRLYQSEVNAVEAKYKVEELQREQTNLQRNDEYRVAEIRKYKLIFGGVIVLLILSGFLNVFYWKKK